MRKTFTKLLLSGILLSAIQFSAADEKSPSPQYQMPPLDGVRHGATKDVFDKLVKDFKARPYQVAKRSDGVLADFTNGHCMDMLNALRNGSAIFVEPKFVTDDYNDTRLDPYKNKYRERVSKEEDGSRPGASWFGGWLSEGTYFLHRPTRSFALYEIDLNKDHQNEVIFYGELEVVEYEHPGTLDHYLPTSHAGYTIYKNNLQVAGSISGPDPTYDYRSNKHLDNYSILFQYSDNKYIAISYLGDDFVDTNIYKLGLTKGLKGRPVYSEGACEFNLGNNK